ncbi:TRAP transporter small permease [Salinicoccus halodurans]|uniref:TRAP-type C4-dicarboxylate transport system, small permease component n=1 Tax=Salinicoccus halodurans TaxID=407035 RepID=A0A0F7D4X1_9STAP|nr:TRAP transporter small permease [Salinicoccus halodurans]AKG74975.1 TRAP-type transport system permease small protein [Salinicoccus halodurans]SFK67497.1 TRAP-type C4-dicarboxylate transport system, small permease component [Salinicoccus halodurans]
MKMMNRVDKILGIISIVFFTALLIVVVTQILSRYFPYQFTWTEELSRYLFVYSMVTAAPVALRKSEFITVDMIPTSLSKNAQRIYESVISVFIMIFSIFLFIYGIQFASLGVDFYAPTLGVDMVYIYASIPILAILLFVYSIVYIIDRYLKNEPRNEVDDL